MNDHVDTAFELLPTLSICTGIRGLERGVERVTRPLRTIAYVEIEAAIIENLVVGMETGQLAPAPVWANLKTFPWAPFRGKIFLLMGGYPCQPFSTAGKRKGTEDPRHLWPHIEGGVRATRPVCVFFENVSGHLTLGFEQVADSLRAMGYAVEAGIYTAAEVGAPHKRARLFILGMLADSKDNVRGLYERSWRCEETKIDIGRPGEMADTSGGIGSGPRSGEGRQSGVGSSEVGNTQSNDEWRQRSGAERFCGQIGESGREGIIMADPGDKGLEGFGPRGSGTGSQFTMSPCSGGDRWPSRPGEPQQAWESPRIISRAAESSMGLAVDGYNFREDLLRALGNGVVEQTAELAFRTLLKKHFA